MERRIRGHEIEELITNNVRGSDQQGTRELAQALGFYDDEIYTLDNDTEIMVAKGQGWRVEKMMGLPYEEPVRQQVIYKSKSNPEKRRKNRLKHKKKLKG